MKENYKVSAPVLILGPSFDIKMTRKQLAVGPLQETNFPGELRVVPLYRSL